MRSSVESSSRPSSSWCSATSPSSGSSERVSQGKKSWTRWRRGPLKWWLSSLASSWWTICLPWLCCRLHLPSRSWSCIVRFFSASSPWWTWAAPSSLCSTSLRWIDPRSVNACGVLSRNPSPWASEVKTDFMFVIVVSVSTGAVVIDHRKRETHNVKCIEVTFWQ